MVWILPLTSLRLWPCLQSWSSAHTGSTAIDAASAAQANDARRKVICISFSSRELRFQIGAVPGVPLIRLGAHRGGRALYAQRRCRSQLASCNPGHRLFGWDPARVQAGNGHSPFTEPLATINHLILRRNTHASLVPDFTIGDARNSGGSSPGCGAETPTRAMGYLPNVRYWAGCRHIRLRRGAASPRRAWQAFYAAADNDLRPAQSRRSSGTQDPQLVPHLSVRCSAGRSTPRATAARMSVSETSKQLHTILPRGTLDPAGCGARASAGGMGRPFCMYSFNQAAAAVSPASRPPAMWPFASIQIRLAMARAGSS